MSFRSYLQDHPRPLVWAWQLTERVLGMLSGGSRRWASNAPPSAVGWFEEPVKRSLFDCQMCGQCVLHYTGMTCPMTCPKQIRNGPCGGVRADGHCEVYPGKGLRLGEGDRAQCPDALGGRDLPSQPGAGLAPRREASWVTFATGRDQWAGHQALPRSRERSKGNQSWSTQAQGLDTHRSSSNLARLLEAGHFPLAVEVSPPDRPEHARPPAPDRAAAGLWRCLQRHRQPVGQRSTPRVSPSCIALKQGRPRAGRAIHLPGSQSTRHPIGPARSLDLRHHHRSGLERGSSVSVATIPTSRTSSDIDSINLVG